MSAEGLTVLGSEARQPIEHVEVFAAPPFLSEIRLVTEEVSSLCPVTSQPDLSTIEVSYLPGRWCVETKSLKLYLWQFRDRPIFAEALASEVAREIMATADPHEVRVKVTQRPRGGITVSATAQLTQ
jgi:7-cyano-7-deazaguanine reductase